MAEAEDLVKALAAAYRGHRGGPLMPDAVLLLTSREQEGRQTDREIDEFEFEAEIAGCTPESRRIIEAAQAIQRAQYEQYGRRISLSAAVRRVKRTKPELFAAARPSDEGARYAPRQ